MSDPMSDLAKLATRIRDDLIEQNQGEDYAAHHVINQLLLLAVGPFSFELVDVVRGDVLTRNKAKDKPSFSDEHSTAILRDVVVGATYRLTCLVDGRREVIEQTGDVEHPENWQHDGARLKDAESDALKRCAMRFGLGLHLWSQEHYRLDAWLAAKVKAERDGAEQSEGRGERAGDGRTGKAAAASGNGSGEPATTRRPSDSTSAQAPAGATHQDPEDRPASLDPAPAGHTPPPQAPAGAPSLAPSLAPAGPVDPDPDPDPDPELSPDELLASLGTDATTAEREFAKAGFTVEQASALFIERYGTNMVGQYGPRSLRRLRGKVIGEYVADAVKLRAAKIAALREQAQAEAGAA